MNDFGVTLFFLSIPKIALALSFGSIFIEILTRLVNPSSSSLSSTLASSVSIFSIHDGSAFTSQTLYKISILSPLESIFIIFNLP